LYEVFKLSPLCRPSLQFNAACVATAIAKTREVFWLFGHQIIPPLILLLKSKHQNIVEETLRALG